jgi:hypothetical protein
VTVSKSEKSGLAGDVLLSLVAGASFTFLLALLTNSPILPRTAGTLLRPGPFFARRIGGGGVTETFLAVVIDGIVYGSLPFIFLRARPLQRRSAPPQQRLIDRRRAHRVMLAAPVFVYGWLRGEPFSENVETIDVSPLGGSFTLSADLLPAQTLIVVNSQSNQEMHCRIARSSTASGGKTLVGFEFLDPVGDFWQVDFVRGPAQGALHPARAS